MKKIIAFILTFIMLLSVAAPAVFATDVRTKNPVIFIRGASRNVYANDVKNDDELIWPLQVDLGAHLKEVLMPCLKELAGGFLTDDFSRYGEELYNAFAPLYEDAILDKNGEASDGSGDGRTIYDYGYPSKNGSYNLMECDFGFDMRLSPLVIADELKDYIDLVYANNGQKKVALVGRCFGGNVISAYLAKYGDHAAEKVESVIMYISSTIGIDTIGALFAGEISLNPDNVDNFMEYVSKDMGAIEDANMQSLIDATVDLLNYARVLGLGTDALQYIVDKLKEEGTIQRMLLASYATFPSYWSMVPTEYYQKAISFSFGGVEDEYAGLIAQLNDYHENVQLTYEEVMSDLEEKGVKFSVVAKYDVPVVPVYDGAEALGDFVAETADISFGATCADHNKTLSQSYLDSLEDKRFVSPDKKVDASTCLYPEKTWFLKNLFHTDFPEAGNLLLAAIIDSKGELTVFDDEKFPQYLDYDFEKEELVPVTGLDPEKPEKGSNEERFTVFTRFMTAILNFFTRLLKGEFSLGNLFG